VFAPDGGRILTASGTVVDRIPKMNMVYYYSTSGS
jgi:hypothetical protein